jgi:alpha-D-ribose 1-methylphosphonate 5-triphosphate diphosphatase PhnM
MQKTSELIDALGEAKSREIEARVVLYEHCKLRLEILESVLKKYQEFKRLVQSPDVDIVKLRRHPLWEEENFDEIVDNELVAMCYPESRWPSWVKKFQRKCD